ncbi:MAG: HDOD domain-containing protein [Proteobacteria bacterium]|nr:HDOD domain-containing protein [Pseudomonadota bacterium]MBU1058977.1 HDOD domain-containing protein [Pseudomonadota bacterium]
MDSKDTLYARLERSKNLPALPQVLLKLIETCDKDDMHLSELSQIIIKDPSISSRVLALVNSAYFGLNNRFSNLDQAVVYLGADTIKNISLTASVEQVFSKLRKNEQFPMSRFWWDSFTTAIYAKRIARQIAYVNMEEAYLAGLLHDLGQLLLWMNFAQECMAIQDLVAGGTVRCSAEEEQIGINHCEAGAWLVRKWKLNSFIADTILYHHASLEQVKGAFPLVKLVYLAEKFGQVGGGDWEPAYDVGAELLGLGAGQIDELRSGVEEEIKGVAESLGIKVKPPSETTDEHLPESTAHDQDLLRQVKNYSLLHGLLGGLVQAESRDAIFKVIEQALSILFDVETIFFFLHDFEQQKLYGCGSTGNSHNQQLQDLVLSVEESTSLLVKSMREKKSISCLQDAKHHLDNLADSQLLEAVGGKGMLYVPMSAKKRSVGVLVIGLPDTPGDDLNSQGQSGLLQLLANQAAMSLYLDEVKRQQAQKIQTARLAAASMAAAKVVHEVNNPLGIIRNYLKILELKLPEKDSLIKELTILDEEIKRISTIIQQLNDFSTPVKHNFEWTDINALLSNLLSILSKSVFYSSRLHVHFEPDPELPSIRTDAGAIKQIVMNLIKNAAEAMKNGGNVYVKTSTRVAGVSASGYGANAIQNGIEVSVHDDGPGLPEKVLSQLFEPFTSTKGKGHSGLGLSIVRTLVTELKGAVTCRSDKEDGTCFTISLPIQQRSAGLSW